MHVEPCAQSHSTSKFSLLKASTEPSPCPPPRFSVLLRPLCINGRPQKHHLGALGQVSRPYGNVPEQVWCFGAGPSLSMRMTRARRGTLQACLTDKLLICPSPVVQGYLQGKGRSKAKARSPLLNSKVGVVLQLRPGNKEPPGLQPRGSPRGQTWGPELM